MCNMIRWDECLCNSEPEIGRVDMKEMTNCDSKFTISSLNKLTKEEIEKLRGLAFFTGEGTLADEERDVLRILLDIYEALDKES